MFNLLRLSWYAYVIVMFFAMLPDAVSSIEDSFMLLFVTSVALVLPEIFNDE
jgi:hypothetical protein